MRSGVTMPTIGVRTAVAWFNFSLTHCVGVGGLSTDPQYQRKGIAKAIMQVLFDKSDESGVPIYLVRT